jgi:hypothetical protein
VLDDREGEVIVEVEIGEVLDTFRIEEGVIVDSPTSEPSQQDKNTSVRLFG